MGSKFNWRSFISLGMLMSFIIMAFSGIILYIAPEGSLSRWIDWKILGLGKNDWEAQHTLFSYVFFIFAVLHIFRINWGMLISYFKRDLTSLKPSIEAIISVFLILALFFGTAAKLEAFTWVYDQGSAISDTWGKDRTVVENARDLSFIEVVQNEWGEVDVDELISDLFSKKIIIEKKDARFFEVAKENKVSPAELYEEIKKTLSN